MRGYCLTPGGCAGSPSIVREAAAPLEWAPCLMQKQQAVQKRGQSELSCAVSQTTCQDRHESKTPGLLPKRDISACNYITQNKKTKLEHGTINAGSIDFCPAPSWLINSRCSYKPIPVQAALQQETNARRSKGKIVPATTTQQWDTGGFGEDF